MHSDGVRVSCRSRNVTRYMTVTIQHNQYMSYNRIPGNTTFITDCKPLKYDVDFVCPMNSYRIVHHCNGSAAKLKSHCPGIKDISVFQNLEDLSKLDTCEVVSLDDVSTTCLCKMEPSGTRRLRRSLAGVTEEDVGYLEVAAMTEQVSEDFAGTIYEAKNFDSIEDVGRVLTVLLMYGAMWIVGLALTWYYAVRGSTKDRKGELNEQLALQRKVAAASSKSSVDKIKKYLDAYVRSKSITDTSISLLVLEILVSVY